MWWTWPPVWHVHSPWLRRGWKQKVLGWPSCWSGKGKGWGGGLSCLPSECTKPWWGTWQPGRTWSCRGGSCGSSPGCSSASEVPSSPPGLQTGSWACHPPAGATASCGSHPPLSPAGCICSPSASSCQCPGSPKCHRSDTGRRYGAGASQTGGFEMVPTVYVHYGLWRTAHLTHSCHPGKKKMREIMLIVTRCVCCTRSNAGTLSDSTEVYAILLQRPVVISCTKCWLAFGICSSEHQVLSFLNIYFIPQEHVITSLSLWWQSNAALEAGGVSREKQWLSALNIDDLPQLLIGSNSVNNN